MQTYSLREVRSMLGLSRAVMAGLIGGGFVTPGRGPRREYRFSFQDLVLLRTAHQLQAAQIPPRRILQSLRKLRARLPEAMPLSGLRITAVGNDVAVREGGVPLVAADSGQLLMDFEFSPFPAAAAAPLPAPGTATVTKTIAPGRTKATPAPQQMNAAAWFARGVELEAADPRGAQQAYRRAIDADPDAPDAYLNLGVLLGEAARMVDAVRLYRQAVARMPRHALLHFNLAVMLEDSGEIGEALAAYERCLALDPDMADAHFNSARLHDQLGHAQRAIRHYSAYRRLKQRAT